MNPKFLELMAEATRLTQQGDLKAATAAIQTALGASLQSPPVAQPGVAPLALEVGPALPVAQSEPGISPTVHKETHERFVEGHFKGDFGACDYRLYCPPDAQSRPRALVVMLHGCTQTPEDFALGTSMNALARAEGFFVLYPTQSRRANPQLCWNWFRREHQERGRGEPALLADLTLSIAGEHRIDRDRIYVAGLSAGGAMAVILGETYPDIFAAVGVHSGLAAGAAMSAASALKAMQGMGTQSDASSGVPIIVFHGDADATVDFSNGAQIIAAAIGTEGVTEEEGEKNGRRFTRQTYRTKEGSTRAELWTLHGSGHAWSGGDARGSFTDTLGPNASAEMARFLLKQRRKRQRA